MRRNESVLMAFACILMVTAGCAVASQPDGAPPATVTPVLSTPTLSATNTPAPVPTHTPTPAPTHTPAPSPTITPRASETATPEPTSTMTPTPTDTPEPTAIPAPTATPTTSANRTVEMEIKLFQFEPPTITVDAGTTIVWTNRDDIQHTITSGTPDAPTGRFDSGFFYQGETYARTFTEPGEYQYFCRRHPSMRGVVIVVPAS